jgi:transposase-like protein
VGRESGQIHLSVCYSSGRSELEPKVLDSTLPAALVNTDEWSAYSHLPEKDRELATVCHSKHEWARDDDGDGIREVHNNTMEGIWTGLRNFLRTFRGVHKKYLQQYVAIFEWAHNVKVATVEFLRALLGINPT